MELILFIVALCASTVGAISGIGGGVIIKPVMDAITGLDAASISFMSGCTVLTMALSSYVRGMKDDLALDYHTSVPLALGGAVGGIVGKGVFSNFTGNVSLVQAIMLLVVNVGVLLYMIYKGRLQTKQMEGILPAICFGFFLGGISAFLGIGGGPINIAVLSYFYSMSPKMTAKNSLFIILFSQITSFTVTISAGAPSVNLIALLLMCVGGAGGAFIGSKLSKKFSEQNVDTLFTVVLIALIALGGYNVYAYAM
ncbi:MAG: sulfite exporter TauE/SafE family protein [Faecalibacterium sp.]